MDSIAPLLPLLLLGAMFWFLIIKPQRRRQQEAQATRNALEAGSRVMTTAGLYGTVEAIEGDEVLLEIAPGVTVRYVAAAIAKVIEPEAPGTAASPGSSVIEDDTAAG